MQSLIHDFLYHAIWGQRDADARPVPSLVLHPDEGTLYWGLQGYLLLQVLMLGAGEKFSN